MALDEWPLPKKRTVWSKTDMVFLKENYKKLGISDCSKKLGRTAGAVQTKAWHLGLAVPHPPSKGSRAHKLKQKYGMSIEEYDRMWEAQSGVCAICHKPETWVHQNGEVVRLAVDHCHASGDIRALLCRQCNLMLGNAKDDINILDKAIHYLRKYNNG